MRHLTDSMPRTSFARGAYSHSPHFERAPHKGGGRRDRRFRTTSQGLGASELTGFPISTFVGDSHASSRVTPDGTSSGLNSSVDISRIGTLSGRRFCPQKTFTRASTGSYRAEYVNASVNASLLSRSVSIRVNQSEARRGCQSMSVRSMSVRSMLPPSPSICVDPEYARSASRVWSTSIRVCESEV